MLGQVTEEDYQSVLDRVASTKDFAVVRDSILFFLQVCSYLRCGLSTKYKTNYVLAAPHSLCTVPAAPEG
jgi:hypothetical protein